MIFHVVYSVFPSFPSTTAPFTPVDGRNLTDFASVHHMQEKATLNVEQGRG